ncbi:MAG: NAD(P)/FAD-dependent oxidoreductase [bacterium]
MGKDSGHMMGRRVIVIGAGAAGLVAAGQAAEAAGHARAASEVVVLEKMTQPGRKLRITGNGRCNLTNWDPLPEFIAQFGRNGRFLRSAFSQFFAPELVALLKRIGVPTVTEGQGRVFPASGRAQDVVDALARWAGAAGVRFATGSPAERLVVEDGRVTGVGVGGAEIHTCDAAILATGGASYPATGSTGDGYRLATAVGHNIFPIRPALVPLETAGGVARRLQGVSLGDVSVRVLVDGEPVAAGVGPSAPRGPGLGAARGEMLFTHFGVSGPVIIRVSNKAVDALVAGAGVTLSLDLAPDLAERDLDARLLEEFATHGRRKVGTVLGALLPGKMVDVFCDLAGVSPDKPANQLTADERRRLREWLRDFRLEVTGHRGFNEAIVTAGGVDLREVDPRTMASRLVKGLYFAGEVLDLDGASGGYNLQAAFSTGWLAGHSAALAT